MLEEMKEVSFAKGELSIREGERDPFVWFVKTGLVRAFVEREGKDKSTIPKTKVILKVCGFQ